MKFGILQFPGSNSDQDTYYAIKDVLGEPVEFIWHREKEISGVDCVILPGGFSFGDYLRTGAIAKVSPIIEAVRKYADNGGLVIGISNGFQILCEADLLPGALMENVDLQFICGFVNVRVENADTRFTSLCKAGQVLSIPIAHQLGNYVCDPQTLTKMEANKQIILRYCDAQGNVTPEANQSGSTANIAGIINERGNVAGMMPYPERAVENILGGTDGRLIFASMLQNQAEQLTSSK